MPLKTDKDFMRLFVMNKANPSLALFQAFKELSTELKEKTDSEIDRSISDFQERVIELVDERLDTIERKMEKSIPDLSAVLEQVKGTPGYTPEKGKDYDDGKDADPDVVAQRLLPVLISYFDKIRPKNGETPSDEKLLALIKANMPEIKNGEDADNEYIITELCKEIPKHVQKMKIDVDVLKAELLVALESTFTKEELKGEVIVERVNALPIEREKQIGKEHIRDLVEDLRVLRQSIRELKKDKGGGGGGGGGGGDIIHMKDLSSQTNGITLSFTVPKHRKAIMVIGSDFPSVLFENNGFTVNVARTQITLTVTNAPSTGSQLGFQYVV